MRLLLTRHHSQPAQPAWMNLMQLGAAQSNVQSSCFLEYWRAVKAPLPPAQCERIILEQCVLIRTFHVLKLAVAKGKLCKLFLLAPSSLGSLHAGARKKKLPGLVTSWIALRMYTEGAEA